MNHYLFNLSTDPVRCETMWLTIHCAGFTTSMRTPRKLFRKNRHLQRRGRRGTKLWRRKPITLSTKSLNNHPMKFQSQYPGAFLSGKGLWQVHISRGNPTILNQSDMISTHKPQIDSKRRPCNSDNQCIHFISPLSIINTKNYCRNILLVSAWLRILQPILSNMKRLTAFSLVVDWYIITTHITKSLTGHRTVDLTR